MQATVRHELSEAVVGYEEKPRDQWLFDYPAQVTVQREENFNNVPWRNTKRYDLLFAQESISSLRSLMLFSNYIDNETLICDSVVIFH